MQLSSNRVTLADILAQEKEERIELIDGVPIAFVTPPRIHQTILGEIIKQFCNDKKRTAVYYGLTVRPFERDGDHLENVDTMVIPDICIICDQRKLDDIGCKGAPDLILEILSPSTQRHDRLTKFNLYQRAGVREYWIVDPKNQSVQSFVLEDGHYQAVGFGAAGDSLKASVLEDCVLDLSQVFEDQAGGFVP